VAAAAVERAPWDSKAGTYGPLTGRITVQVAEPLLDAAGVVARSRLLDVGTGPGYAARLATERGALATGVDIADELLAVARRSNPGIRFLRADAEALPFEAASFDALVSNFAIGHVTRPELAVSEWARVVAPRGAIALSTWEAPDHNRFLGILVDSLAACGLAPAGDAPLDTARLLRNAGLQDVEVRPVSLVQRVSDVDELWEGLLGGSVRTAGVVMRQSPGTRRRIRSHLERLSERYRDDAGLAIPVRARIISGRP
jgi:SAM-dependent methyltransferase